MSNDPGLANAVLYNPRQLTRETLKAIFTARRGLLDRLVEDLRAERPSHQLIIGPRGMGKTTLLRRLGIAIEEDPELKKRLLPLTFPEEQYNVGSLGEFYLNCLDALADYLDKHDDAVGAQKLDAVVAELRKHTDAELVDEAEAALVRHAKSMKRQFVLLVDNLSIIIDRLSDKEKWRLREWLSRSEQRPVLVAATVKFISDTADYGQALYEFLHVHELGGCDTEEAAAVLRELANVFKAPQVQRWLEVDPARLAVLNRLAGGAPRTLVMLFQLLVQGMDGPIFQELDSLLDLATPLYKARFEELPDQAQRVVDALAIHWDPATRRELEQESRIEGNAVSTQLSRLAKMGVVEEVTIPGEAKTAYQIAERFFNIWYLMRASRRSRHQLRWLVEFLKAFYSADERETLAHKLLHSDGCEPLSHGKRLLALSQAVEDRHLRRELQNTAFYTFAKADQKQRADIDLSDIDRNWLRRLDELKVASEKETHILTGIEEDPKSAFRYRQLGDFYREHSRQYLKAEEAFRKATEIDPNDARAWSSLGKLLTEDLGKDTEAEQAYRKAIITNPKNEWGWLYLGDLFKDKMGRYAEAEQAYLEAIETNPKEEWGWVCLGSLFQDLRRYAEAEQAYRKAIETNPKAEWGWVCLGILFHVLRRYVEAEQAYHKAIECAPTYAEAWSALGLLLTEHLGRHTEAEEAIRKAIELDPASPRAWLQLGNLLTRRDDPVNDAESAYRKAVELAPHEATPKDYLAWFLYLQRERAIEAESLARAARELNPEPWFSHTLACVLAWQGKVIESLTQIRHYLSDVSANLNSSELYSLECYFRELVRHNQAELGVRLLEELDRGEAWRPLVEALRAAGKRDRDSLKRINPEQREPAEKIYDFFMESLQEESQDTPQNDEKPASRKKRRS